MTVIPFSTSAFPRLLQVLGIACACLLAYGCSDSSSESNGIQSDDPTTVLPGEAPVINAEIAELAPVDFTPPAAGTPNLYATLVAAGTFTRLLTLIDQVGLSGPLQGTEPLTIFAPTDDAFAAFDQAIGIGVIDTFTTDELEDRLSYHAVLGNVLDSTVLRDVAGRAVEMANGSPAAINLGEGGALMINSATLLSPDVLASNGVLHVIDTVLTPPVVQGDPNNTIPPPSSENIAGILLNRPDYSTLLYLVEQAGLTELLQGDNDSLGWTLFAPSDDAFERAPEDVFALDAAGAEQLVQLHLFPGRLSSDALGEGELAMTRGTVQVTETADGFTIGGARIVGRDRVVSNGIIHFVDIPMSPVGL